MHEISLVEQLVERLPRRVGAPLSVANLRQDLEVDHKTVERWLTILENLYLCFRVAPFGASLRYFAEGAPIPRFYQVHRGDRHFATGKITVLPFTRFCQDLALP